MVFFCAGTAFLVQTHAVLAGKAHAIPSGVAEFVETLDPTSNTLQCVIFGGLLMLVISVGQQSKFRRILEHPVLVYIGKISYGVYVFHLLLFELFLIWATAMIRSVCTLSPVLEWPLIVTAMACLAILVSSLSWHLFEQPVLRLKSRFRYQV